MDIHASTAEYAEGLSEPYLMRATDAGDWEDSGFPGFLTRTLYTDEVTGDSTMLMRVEPGAFAETHAHDQFDHVYVIDGTFSDQFHTYNAGDYFVRAPWFEHTANSADGGTILVMYVRANRFEPTSFWRLTVRG